LRCAGTPGQRLILEPELNHEEIKMKTTMTAILLAGAVTLGYGALHAAEITLVDDQMGLSKSSVFDDPNLEVFEYPQGFDSKPMEPAYSGAPPQIPHNIDDYLPISAKKNMCTNCHEKPARIGQKKIRHIPTPMPESHYVKAEDGSLKRSDKRHICVHCHTPQAEVKELIGNTFAQ
jgi:cytochrome c-type protein NapB